MKKLLIGTIAAAVVASSAMAADYTLKFSHVVSDNTPKGKAARFFEQRLEELSGGKIDVQVYPSSQLYKDNAVLKALRLNSVQMAAPSFSKFGKIVPQLALFDLPFIFRDAKHLHDVQDGEVGEALKAKVTAKGIVALNYWDNAFKQLSSNKNALSMPADAQGQKFRIMSSKVLEAQFHAVGANPQMMPFSEVYSGLQQGVIDAAENPISNIYTKKFHEVQKYLTISNHGYLGYLVVMSKKFWNSLPADLQANVKQAMNEATDKERQYAAELNDSQLELIKEYAKKTGKLEINELTAEQKEAWRKAVSKIYPEFYSDRKIGKDLIEKTIATK
ncbi:TRAP transporter substrate-binding protein [Poseidonibacter lekithochrous]|uniref:TRAP transporter substrate-binding protein n=1 Tax=Poseidonibacter TaxID=2321187 RepID=UPI001C09C73B|nr:MULTISPECIES: TRAP transporter substrate-binding protein [Poseidonibacter]MBU3015961.1 TRAP transporter substrate-binding protein [Poseidonibacter lekithochrous]MDO6829260.1 TRAP transporter substrate-binding protein [Poseidonibacter sp. 1_MG-2023]